MSATFAIAIVMRWLHVLSAIIAIGGIFFMRHVLHPIASDQLNDVQHEHFRGAIRKRWQRIVHICILLFLVSGFYNFIVVTAPLHSGQPLYHALFGIKFLLAIALFALALMVTSSKDYAERFRRDSAFWMGVIFGLGVLIVLISGVMKNLPITVQ